MNSYRGSVINYASIDTDTVQVYFENGSTLMMNADMLAYLIVNGVLPAIEPLYFNKRQECTDYRKTNNSNLYSSNYLGHGVVMVTNRATNEVSQYSTEMYQNMFAPDSAIKILNTCISVAEYNEVGRQYVEEQRRIEEQRRLAEEERRRAAERKTGIKISISKSRRTVQIKRGDEVLLPEQPISYFIQDLISHGIIIQEGSVVTGVRENPFFLTLDNVNYILGKHTEFAEKDKANAEANANDNADNIHKSEKELRKLLTDRGITDKASFKKWMLANHPDKLGGRPNPDMVDVSSIRQILRDRFDVTDYGFY